MLKYNVACFMYGSYIDLVRHAGYIDITTEIAGIILFSMVLGFIYVRGLSNV